MSGKKANTPLKRLQEQLQAVDVLFEVRDARIPDTSMHPKTRELFGNKPRVIVFCKEDLADPAALSGWVKGLSQEDPNQRAVALSLKFKRGKEQLISLATDLCKEKLAARERKGLLPRPLRAAVVGLPNVGKSSLINWLTGRNKAAVANTPGVTRGNSWIRIHPKLELLDTPGMLPLTSFKGNQALKLALCNVLPGEHYDVEETAMYGLSLLWHLYPRSLQTYSNPESDGTDLEAVARARTCLKAGGVYDLKRAAGIFLSEFRSGKLARVVLDRSDLEERSDHLCEEDSRISQS